MGTKIIVFMTSVFLLVFSGTVYGQDSCDRYHDMYRVCVEKRDVEMREIEYNVCQTYDNQIECEIDHGCYWNADKSECISIICYSDANSDSKVTGADLGILKKEYGRRDCPTTPSDTSTTTSILYPAPVEKTGQESSYAYHDDGWYEKGVEWPEPRFNVDGTGLAYLDSTTGLMWTKFACIGSVTFTWLGALDYIDNHLNLEEPYHDWRLPNIKELQSLIDFGRSNPALPESHPFYGLGQWYWSSTTVNGSTGTAWSIDINTGFCHGSEKDNYARVWAVRGGQ